MNLFNLMATLGLDDKEYQEGINNAKGGATGLKSTITKLAIPAALAAIGKKSIDVGMDFEASMSQVAATMGMTASEIAGGSESFDKLKEAAKKAGAETQFSATQSAEALNYLALAGYSVDEAVSTLPTVLNLAAAGGMDLAYASDLVTDSMSSLGLEIEDVDKFTDQLAKTSQKSNTNVAQLGEALLTVGGTAKVLAGGTVEANTQLGILADNGIKGAEGGTALRNIILALTPTTDKAVAAFKKLGVETYDMNGNLRPTNEIFAEMNDKLKTLSQEERTRVLSDIFNKVDLKSANALLANSGERFNELSKEIENSQGAAKNMAETMNANLKGALTSLNSALEGVGIAIYEKMSSALTGGVQRVVEYTRAINDAINNSKSFGEAIGKIATIIGQAAAEAFTSALKIVENLANGLYEGSLTFPQKAQEMITNFLNGITNEFPNVLQKGVEIVNNIISGVINSIPNIMQGAMILVVGFIQGIFLMIPQIVQAGMDIVDNLVTEIMNNLPKIVETAIQMMNTLVQTILENLPKIIDSAFQAIDRFAATIKANLPTIINAGYEMLMAIVNAILNALPQLLTTAVNLIVRFAATIMQNLPTIINAGIQILLKLVQGIIQMFPKLVETGFKLIVELVKAIINNLPKLFNAGMEMVKEVMRGLKQLPIQAVELAKQIPGMIWDAIKNAGSWLGGAVMGWVKNLIPGGKTLSIGLNATGSLSGASAYSLAGTGLARGIGGTDFGRYSQTTNVSLNIAGREFDKLVIRTVTNNYDKIESIVQQKSRGRR